MVASCSPELRNFGFIKLSRREKVKDLMSFPAAFMLATQIAMRARRTDKGLNPHNLKIGEALVGDYHAIGLTEQKYRTAKAQLAKWHIATFRPTSLGCIATLVDAEIYDINPEIAIERSNVPETNQQRTAIERVSTKNNGRMNKKPKKPVGEEFEQF